MSHTRLVGTGLLAVLAAMAVTTLTAALARNVGVEFEIPSGGESIPLPGFAVMTGVFSATGIAIAAGLRRWSRHPATWFIRTTVALTVLSLAAPLVSGASTAAVTTLMGLHLVAAGVVIPLLARCLTRLGPRGV